MSGHFARPGQSGVPTPVYYVSRPAAERAWYVNELHTRARVAGPYPDWQGAADEASRLARAWRETFHEPGPVPLPARSP